MYIYIFMYIYFYIYVYIYVYIYICMSVFAYIKELLGTYNLTYYVPRSSKYSLNPIDP